MIKIRNFFKPKTLNISQNNELLYNKNLQSYTNEFLNTKNITAQSNQILPHITLTAENNDIKKNKNLVLNSEKSKSFFKKIATSSNVFSSKDITEDINQEFMSTKNLSASSNFLGINNITNSSNFSYFNNLYTDNEYKGITNFNIDNKYKLAKNIEQFEELDIPVKSQKSKEIIDSSIDFYEFYKLLEAEIRLEMKN